MSSSIWARVARTCFIRPRIGSSPLLGRSYVLLAAKPVSNVLLRPTPLITRQQSSVAALKTSSTEDNSSHPEKVAEDDSQPDKVTENEEQLPEFSSLEKDLHPGIYRALTRGPFQLTTMSSVQAVVLPSLPELVQRYNPENPSPRDLMVKAKTGTGKTLAFLIPAVEARLKALKEFEENEKNRLQGTQGYFSSDSLRRFASTHAGVVIISPTRELATQIGNEARKLVQHLKGVEVHLFVGGEDKRRQLRDFKYRSADIIVATPGRFNDILESSEQVAKSVAHTQTFILDEADTLLDMGFMADILNILKYLPPPPERQTFLFSATLSPAIRKIASESLSSDHKYINCVSDDAPPTHAHIPQFHTVLPSAKDQFPHILRVLAHDQLTNPKKSKTVVFFPTTKFTALFADFLRMVKKDALPAGAHTSVYELHSQRSQDSRVRASNAFRSDKSGASVLVTSDVSARGVDYPGVTRVIQVGVPTSGEIYIHRVGRTGRAGTEGRGDLIILPFERKFLSTQMKGLPLRPLTVDEHASQLLELANKYDEDPKAFWGGEIPVVKKPKFTIRDPRIPNPTFFRPTSLVPVLEDIPRIISETISHGDNEVYGQTFASLLGYYVGLADDLRLMKTDIVESCKTWAVEACGIPEPYVSPTMMERLGISSERRRLDRQEERRMDGIRKRGFQSSPKSSWMGRGKTRVRETRERDDRQSFDSSSRYTRSSEDGYRKAFEGDRPRRTFEGDRPRRTFEGDRPRRTFEGDRPRRTFEGDRPRRTFEGDRSGFRRGDD